MKKFLLIVMGMITVFAVGVGGVIWAAARGSQEVAVSATRPTGDSKLFDATLPPTADLLATPTPTLTPTPIPTFTPTPFPSPTPTFVPPLVVFDDAIHPDWTLEISTMPHETRNTTAVFQGVYAIEARPEIGGRVLLFTKTSGPPLRYDDVDGIAFRIYSGELGLAIDELAMTVIGSNAEPKWSLGDTSVRNSSNPNPDWIAEDDPISNLYAQTYSESLIAFMGIVRDIPPNTWVWVTNWLDDREFDPEYEYITGFYLKTETTVEHALGIDAVEILPYRDLTP